jgi:hypothetical protein
LAALIKALATAKTDFFLRKTSAMIFYFPIRQAPSSLSIFFFYQQLLFFLFTLLSFHSSFSHSSFQSLFFSFTLLFSHSTFQSLFFPVTCNFSISKFLQLGQFIPSETDQDSVMQQKRDAQHAFAETTSKRSFHPKFTHHILTNFQSPFECFCCCQSKGSRPVNH